MYIVTDSTKEHLSGFPDRFVYCPKIGDYIRNYHTQKLLRVTHIVHGISSLPYKDMNSTDRNEYKELAGLGSPYIEIIVSP